MRFTAVALSFLSLSILVVSGCGNRPVSPAESYTKAEQLLSQFRAVSADEPAKTEPATPDKKEDKKEAELGADKDFLISIPKAALQILNEDGKVTQKGTDFLLSASLIPQEGSPTSTAMNGKVVYFSLYSDGLDMYESTDGAVVTDDLPSNRLLAKFPVAKQTEDSVLINFDSGMRSLFIAQWHGGADKFDGDQLDTTLDVSSTRVLSLTYKSGRITIKQTVQARVQTLLGPVVTPKFQMRYYLAPYKITDYQPKIVKNTRHVRFFKGYGNLQKETGRTNRAILRFDKRQPLTIHYSANVPPLFEEAVRDGIMYWSRALKPVGLELKTGKAPEGITAPNPDYNIVQWVPWDAAGSAYADVIADPRTGQALHGQAYLTSVFGISGVQRARMVLRALQTAATKPDLGKNEFTGVGVKFNSDTAWKPAGFCQNNEREFAFEMAKGVAQLVSLDKATDQNILDMSRNYVREVVAHEVGHILGLRHHFAGNLLATLTAVEQGEWAKKALTEGKFDSLPSKIPSSSVMEYTEYFAAAYIGQLIKEGKVVLPYDQAAIEWGYADNKAIEENKTLYCSDEEAGKFGDCETFDPTGDPFLGAQVDLARTMDSMPNIFLENFVSAVAPVDSDDVEKVEDVVFPNDFLRKYAQEPVSAALRRSLSWFRADIRMISIENSLPLGLLTPQTRLDAKWVEVQKKVALVGGTDRLLFGHLPLGLTLDTSKKENTLPSVKFNRDGFVGKVKEALDSTYSKFIGPDGKEHSFTEGERKTIEAIAKEFALFYEKDLLGRSLTAYAENKLNLSREANGIQNENELLSKIESQYAKVAREIILAEDPSKTLTGKVETADVIVKDFKYPAELRKLAPQILAAEVGSTPYWADTYRSSIKAALKAKVDSALLAGKPDFKDSVLAPNLRNWYQEQRRIMMMLPD